METYSVWHGDQDGIPVWSLTRGQDRPKLSDGTPDPDCVRCVAVFEAASWDEAVQRFDREADVTVQGG